MAVPTDVLVSGEPSGAIGEDKGVISSGRFFFWARDWLTRPVRARGRSGSMGWREAAGAADRPRAEPRRAVVPRAPRALAAEDGEKLDDAGDPRPSDSRITIPSSGPPDRPSPPGRPWAGGPAHRAAAGRSATED